MLLTLFSCKLPLSDNDDVFTTLIFKSLNFRNGDIDELEKELEAVLCGAFTAYALECSSSGIILDWRTADLCRECTFLAIHCFI